MRADGLLGLAEGLGDGHGARVLGVDGDALSKHFDDPDLFSWQGVNRRIEPGPVIRLVENCGVERVEMAGGLLHLRRGLVALRVELDRHRTIFLPPRRLLGVPAEIGHGAIEADFKVIELFGVERSPSELNRERDSRIGFDLLEDRRRGKEAAGMALSDDLRERVVGAVVEGGMSRNAAAKRFGVSIASAVRWVARFKAKGEISRLRRGEIVVLVV